MATVTNYGDVNKAAQSSNITAKDVADYLNANPGLTDAQIAEAMNQYNVSPELVSQATGVPLEEVNNRLAKTVTIGPASQTPRPSGGTALGAADATTSNGMLSQDTGTSLATIATPKGISDTAIKSYFELIDADTTLAGEAKDKLIADKMVEFGVTPVQVGRVTGAKASDVLNKFKEIYPDVDPMAPVTEALSSPSLTKEQYDVLSGYFGNENLPQDQNQIGDFVGKKTGFEFANYAATRDASQGGGDTLKQQQLLQGAYVPFIGATPGSGMMPVADGDGYKMVPYVIDPITGKQQELKVVDAENNIYAVDYPALGRSASDPEEMGYIPSMLYQFDPEKNQATLLGGTADLEKVSGGFFEGLRPLLPMAAAALGAYMFSPASASSVAWSNLAEQVGFQAFGLTGTAAQMATAALVSGTSTGLLTGDPKAAVLAAALAAGGIYAKDAGLFKSTMDSLGFGEQWDKISAYLDSTGGKTSYSDFLSNMETGAFDIGGNQAAIDAANINFPDTTGAFDLAGNRDALNAAGNLTGSFDLSGGQDVIDRASGVNTNLANNTGSFDLGGNQDAINAANNNFIDNTGAFDQGGNPDILNPNNPLLPGPIDTNLADNTGAFDQGGNPDVLDPNNPLFPGPGNTGGTTIPGAATVKTGLEWLQNLLGGGSAGGLFGNQSANQLAALLASGALTQGTIDQLRSLGSTQQQQFSDLATQATQDIQFTPYGVTTSLFGTQPTEGGMAGTLTPQGQQLSDAALQAALSSYGQAGTMDLNQMAADRMAQYQQLVAPEQQRARLTAESRLAAQGRLGIGAGGGEYAPELKALEDAIAKQNLQFAIQAPQEALAQRTALLQQGASAAAVPTGLAGQQLQAIQQGGTLGQQAANTAYQAGGLFGNLAGTGLASQLQANIAAGTISAERAKSIGQALQGAFAPVSTSGTSSGGGLVNDILNLISGGGNAATNSSIYGDQALVDWLQANRDPNNIV